MVFQNDMAYRYNSISENDRYLVFELSISRNEDKMFLYDLETKEKIEISNKRQIIRVKDSIKTMKIIFIQRIMKESFTT